MYVRIPLPHASRHIAASTLRGLSSASNEVVLLLSEKLGGATLRVAYRSESPPTSLQLYPYDRIATGVFKFMDGPYGAALAAKGAWLRFDTDVGWSFWLRVVNGRTELKLSPATQTTFAEIQRHLAQPGPAPISLELADASQSGTTTGRVFLWLIKNLVGIVATEQKYSIDRRAIAGAIAWEALQNPYTGDAAELATVAGVARFSGPGKVHFKEFRTEEGNPSAREVEQRNRLPRLTLEERHRVLATTSGALAYIGVIMREIGDVAARSGYYLNCDLPMLTTFYNAWNIAQVEAFFANRKAPAPLVPNAGMGTWVGQNIAFLEAAVGKTPNGFCKMSRGY